MGDGALGSRQGPRQKSQRREGEEGNGRPQPRLPCVWRDDTRSLLHWSPGEQHARADRFAGRRGRSSCGNIGLVADIERETDRGERKGERRGP